MKWLNELIYKLIARQICSTFEFRFQNLAVVESRLTWACDLSNQSYLLDVRFAAWRQEILEILRFYVH